MRLLLLGATGLVGSRVLDLAIADPRVTDVTALTRRPLPVRSGLWAPIVDFDSLPRDPAIWAADAVICAFGTTLKAAGSRERFRQVDHDYPLEIARLAKAHGARTFVLNSAKGADMKSHFFYSRVKGETERDILDLGFERTILVRPGLIDGARSEPRPLEQWAGRVLAVLDPILPAAVKPNPPETIARAMLEAVFSSALGVTIVPSQELL